MEQFDLYTKDRLPLNQTMNRGEPTPDGCYRLVVHVCIFNSSGEMLIQQRQPFKKGWSDMWDLSCGGSVVSGEDSRTAAEREVAEELGVTISLKGTRPVLTIHLMRALMISMRSQKICSSVNFSYSMRKCRQRNGLR